MVGILGIKKSQDQIFNEKGERVPVTVLDVSSCYLIGLRTKEKDGYNALILGCQEAKKIKKPILGQLKKAGLNTPLRFLREIRFNEGKDVNLVEKANIIGIRIGQIEIFPGQKILPNIIIKKGDLIDVSGTSKGKGFQGVVKRHGFAGGPRTRGQSDRERAPGSIGMTTTPGRVFKGKRMAGRMGGEKVTIKNLQVLDINESTILIKGLIPGFKGNLVVISKKD